MKLLIMQFSNLLSLQSSLVQIFSSTPSVSVPPLMSETKFHTDIEPQAKLVLYILTFMFLDSGQKVLD
jgi:hypothetical protein